MTQDTPSIAAIVEPRLPAHWEKEFWARTERRGPDDCWLWTGSRTKNGYGQFGGWRATHISLELNGQPRPSELLALHSCDNPQCVNPAHLRWGTFVDNARDMYQRGRAHSQKPTCKRGHPLEGDNLRILGRERRCLACEKLRQAKSRKSLARRPILGHRQIEVAVQLSQSSRGASAAEIAQRLSATSRGAAMTVLQILRSMKLKGIAEPVTAGSIPSRDLWTLTAEGHLAVRTALQEQSSLRARAAMGEGL